MKLNLGCGHRKVEGFINCDSSPECTPDLLLDLEQPPWPFDSGEVDEVLAQHVFEHIGQTPAFFIGFMKELHRVCAPGALVRIEVPHPRSDGFLGDPTHVRPITPQVMSLFSKQFNRECAEKGWPNTPLGLMHDIDFEITDTQCSLQPQWARLQGETAEKVQQTIDSYFNVVADIRMTLRCVK